MPKSLLSDYSAGEIREELLLYETGAGAVATLETIVMNRMREKTMEMKEVERVLNFCI